VRCIGYHRSNNASKPTWCSTASCKTEKTCLLIDVAIPDDSDGKTKETDELRKYEDQETEFRRMWKVRTKIVPVIIGALGTLKKG
jgi:hypothetical protein